MATSEELHVSVPVALPIVNSLRFRVLTIATAYPSPATLGRVIIMTTLENSAASIRFPLATLIGGRVLSTMLCIRLLLSVAS